MDQRHLDGSHRHDPTIYIRSRRRSWLTQFAIAVLIFGGTALPGSAAAGATTGGPGILALEVQSLDGGGNNVANPTWGQAGTPYTRVAPARYADGRNALVAGPNARNVSNRVFNDVHQNVFSERRVTQWGFVWGQFLDHTFGLRDAPGVGDTPDPSSQNIPFNANDPLEEFDNATTDIPFTRSFAAPGTGVNGPRQQTNTNSSYIDAFAVYGGTNDRLEWMRNGPVDANLANNSGLLMLPGGYLPTRDARGNAGTAPAMDVDGRLQANPNRARVAGDVRANENLGLLATQTLFAREHNRIVSQLPNTLTDEQKFQTARRVIIAEQQFITYNEFLPAMGVQLPAYAGYNPAVNANLTNEFATVGYRAHSQIHGEFELETNVSRYTPAQLDQFRAQGIEVTVDGADVVLAIPLNVAFFNPDLLTSLQLGPMLEGIGLESEYKNDEQIDNQLRSVLFQVPVPGNPECLDGPTLPQCFRGVVDLGAIDIERGRDHGMPTYNDMRRAFGLAPRTSFTAITGEASDAFPRDPALTPGNEINDPDSLDVTRLLDKNGAPIALDSPAAATDPIVGERRTPLAARLRAVYGSVDRLDAFVGMIAERHLAGAEFGELQLAIWRSQFRALRDGDRFFYGSTNTAQELNTIRTLYGVDFRRTLSQIIASNTDIPAADLRPNVFVIPAAEPLDPGRVLGVQSNRCVDVPLLSTADNTELEIFDCNGGANQSWNQHPDGTIRDANSGKCLDAFGGPQSQIRDAAVIFVCNGSATQRWRFQADGRIVNLANGRCLDANGAGTANRTRLIMFTCNAAAPNQRFIR